MQEDALAGQQQELRIDPSPQEWDLVIQEEGLGLDGDEAESLDPVYARRELLDVDDLVRVLVVLVEHLRRKLTRRGDAEVLERLLELVHAQPARLVHVEAPKRLPGTPPRRVRVVPTGSLRTRNRRGSGACESLRPPPSRPFVAAVVAPLHCQALKRRQPAPHAR
mgnify:CR=1 FL=1